MPDLGSLQAKNAASLGGVAPVSRQSGIWRGKSGIPAGAASPRETVSSARASIDRVRTACRVKFHCRHKCGTCLGGGLSVLR
jgi:hypothetical protein